MIFVRGFQVDDWTGEYRALSIARWWPGVEPFEGARAVAVAALIAQHGQPGFIFPVVPRPILAGGMGGDQRGRLSISSGEHAASDVFPFFGILALIAVVAAEDP